MGRPWGQQGFLPSLGTTISNLRDKKNFYPPLGKQKKKFVSSRKKEDFETFLGRKHWKNSNMALAGKDKAATLKKNSEK